MNDEKRASRLLPFRLRRGATGNDKARHFDQPHADSELRALLREWEAPSVSRGAEARLLAAFRDEAQRRPSLSRRLLAARVSVPIPLAACVLIALTVLASALAAREPRLVLAAPNTPTPIQTLRIVETPGFGARVTYNFTDFFAVEAEGNFHPRRGGQTLTTGGHVTQGQFGVKAGKRFEKFGVYGKARPGFVSFSGVSTFAGALTQNLPGGSSVIPFFEPRAKTHFSTDVGGVVEFYPSRRVVTRFDFGDTIIRYDGYQLPVYIFPTPLTQSFMLIERPGETRHNFQFTAGVGWRF